METGREDQVEEAQPYSRIALDLTKTTQDPCVALPSSSLPYLSPDLHLLAADCRAELAYLLCELPVNSGLPQEM